MPETKGEVKGDGNRKGPLAGGKLSSLGDKYLFGTDAEVNNRTSTGYPDDRNPDLRPAAFEQIPPTADSGKRVNELELQHRSGDIKFSGGI